MHVSKQKKVISCVSSTCLSFFSLVCPTVVFNMLIAMSCLRPCSGDVEGLCLSCVHYVNIYHTHRRCCKHYRTSVITVVWMSIQSVVLVAFTIRQSRSQSHWAYVVFLVWGILSSTECVFARSCIHEFTHLHNHFYESLLTRPPSISWTFVELHCVVSALRDHVLLPRIAQNLRFHPIQSTLCNPGINPTNSH